MLRLLRVEPRDELEASFTSGELADLIAESGREGLLDRRRVPAADPHAAARRRPPSPTCSCRCPSWSPCRPEPTVGDVAEAVAETGFSRFPMRAPSGDLAGYLHVKDILDLLDDPATAVPAPRVRTLPGGAHLHAGWTRPSPCCGAPGPTWAAPSHRGETVGLVAMEDLVERYVGEVRDATHARERRA